MWKVKKYFDRLISFSIIKKFYTTAEGRRRRRRQVKGVWEGATDESRTKQSISRCRVDDGVRCAGLVFSTIFFCKYVLISVGSKPVFFFWSNREFLLLFSSQKILHIYSKNRRICADTCTVTEVSLVW